MGKHRVKNWSRIRCNGCDGQGYIEVTRRIDEYESLVKIEQCNVCKGSGMGNVSNEVRKVK